jgi:xylan 1,4-beta-xylosidase
MGAPQAPTPAQYAELERAGQLQTMEAPRRVTVANGRVIVTLNLPRQGVSLVRLTW